MEIDFTDSDLSDQEKLELVEREKKRREQERIDMLDHDKRIHRTGGYL